MGFAQRSSEYKKIVQGHNELDQLIDDMVRKLDGDSVERATQAAGDVILKAAALRAPVKSGKLRDSLMKMAHYRKAYGGKGRQYTVSIEVPGSTRFGIMYYAVFVEYGTSKTQAHPFMRPAFESSQQKAVEAFSASLTAELER